MGGGFEFRGLSREKLRVVPASVRSGLIYLNVRGQRLKVFFFFLISSVLADSRFFFGFIVRINNIERIFKRGAVYNYIWCTMKLANFIMGGTIEARNTFVIN